jgi:hypothetical protein
MLILFSVVPNNDQMIIVNQTNIKIYVDQEYLSLLSTGKYLLLFADLL